MMSSILLGLVVPALVAGVVFVAAVYRATSPAPRLAAPLGLIAGFVSGYFLAGLGPWVFSAHWHYLPLVVSATLLAVFFTFCAEGSLLSAAITYGMTVGASAWLLTPTWPEIQPPWVHQLLWATYTILLALLLEPLTTRLPGWVPAFVLAVTLLGAGMVLFFSGSARFAQIAACGAGAMLGQTVVAAFWRDRPLLGGLALPYSVLAAGSLYVGYVNSFSDVPLVSYALVPMAPVCLLLALAPGFATGKGMRRWFVPVMLSLVVLGIAVGWSAVSH